MVLGLYGKDPSRYSNSSDRGYIATSMYRQGAHKEKKKQFHRHLVAQCPLAILMLGRKGSLRYMGCSALVHRATNFFAAQAT